MLLLVVGFLLIDSVLCMQSHFEDCTFYIASCHCMPLYQKLTDRKMFINSVLFSLTGKAKLPMASWGVVVSI